MLRALLSLPGRAIDWWGRADFAVKIAVVVLVGGTLSGIFDLLLLSGQPLFLRVLICINLYAQVFLLLYAPAELRKVNRYRTERCLSDDPKMPARAGDQPPTLPELLENQANQDAPKLLGRL